MIYLLELNGRCYRCRDQWQALWLARVWVAFSGNSARPDDDREERA